MRAQDTGSNDPLEDHSRGDYDVPGTRWTYTPGVGVWDHSDYQMLTWCPTVTRHMINYSSAGEAINSQVSLSVPPFTATVHMADVESGAVWLDRFPASAGAAGTKMRDILRNIVADQAGRMDATPAHPRWTADGRLEVPPADAMPEGYGEVSGEWSEWRWLIWRTMDTPRIALVASLAAAGLYVTPLGMESVFVHLRGGSSVGKTTAAKVAASIFGNPRRVVRPWNVSSKGLLAWLRGLSCLTSFRDEIGQAEWRPSGWEKVVFDATTGARRDVSSRSGAASANSGDWWGALISTGNKSVLENIDNEATAARCIEMMAPFTSNAEQSEAFTEHAEKHYGHGLAAIAAKGPRPDEFRQWVTKAQDDLVIAAGGPARRFGRHLALGVAGARLLGVVCGIEGYHEPVFAAALQVLRQLGATLRASGATPGDRLKAAIIDMIVRRPAQFPTRIEYSSMLTQQIRIPEVYGWDLLTESSIPADLALTSGGLRAIVEDCGLTDQTTALDMLEETGNLIRTKGADERTRFIRVNGKRTRAYLFANLYEADDPPETASGSPVRPSDPPPDTGASTPVPDSNTGSDQACHGYTGISGYEGRTCTREASASTNLPLPLEPPPDEPPEPDPETAPESEHRPADSPPPDAATGPEHPSEGDGTEEGGSSSERGSQTGVSTSALADDAAELVAWSRWITNHEIEIGGQPVDPTGEVARRALDAWHQATGGLRWTDYPGKVGVNAYMRLSSRHQNMPQPERCESALVDEISTGNIVRHLDFLNPDECPEMGQFVTGLDVNKQFLAAAGTVSLGDGEPHVYNQPRSIDALLKLPGYVELAEPLDFAHPAFQGIEAGMWLPNPLGVYVVSRGGSIRASRAVAWQKHGTRLAKHAKGFRIALERLAADPEPYAQLASAAIKAVYAAFYGGMLRSENYNQTGTMRRDWSDLLIAVSWANALRGIDRAIYAVPATRMDGRATTDLDVVAAIQRADAPAAPVLGMCRDTAWWLADSAPYTPAGLQVSTQPGKWKVEKWGPVTEQMIHAHEVDSPYLMRDAVNQSNRDRMTGE